MRLPDEEVAKRKITLKDGNVRTPVNIWKCKRCGYEWFDCTPPRPRDEPICHMHIVSQVMES